nr:sulfate permease [Natronospira proteinivora]
MAADWWQDVVPSTLARDAIAGLVIAALLVPQGMAYAMLAGLPPEMGLYASLLPPALYAVFGSSRYLAVGPVAVISLMVATATATLGQRHGIDPMVAAPALAFMSGLILLIMGLLRLGFLTHFLSRPVLLGFMTAAAILIGLSQLPHALGLSVDARAPLGQIQEVFGQLGAVSMLTAGLTVGTILLILLIGGPLARRLRQLWPHAGSIVGRMGALFAVTFGIGLAMFTGLSDHLSQIGEIPRGLPRPEWPALEIVWILELSGMAFLISLVGLMESVSIGRGLAARDNEDVQPNRELLGIGLSNLGAGLSGAYPVTGGLSRTVVAKDAGAVTPLAGLFAALAVSLVLLFATPLLAELPRAVLAGIILLAIVQLLDVHAVQETWRYNRGDAAVIGITFFGVLSLGVEVGLIVGIMVSIGLLLWRISQPHVAMVGRVPGSEHFRNRERHAVETLTGVCFIRVDESLQFPNSRFLRDTVLETIRDNSDIQSIVLVCSAINDIDSTALATLEELDLSLKARGMVMHLSEVKGPVLDQLLKVDFPSKLSPGRIFFTNQDAFSALQENHSRCRSKKEIKS